MLQRVFIRVEGFSSVERHALNTMFRLSQERANERGWSYEAWLPDSPAPPRMVLIDGACPQAGEALAEIASLDDVGLIWFGAISPAKAWRTFVRPVSWPMVLLSMDEFLEPKSEIDVDLGLDDDELWPPSKPASGLSPLSATTKVRSVLVADADLETRLYVRAKLALSGITRVDEAANLKDAQELIAQASLRDNCYDVLMFDLNLPGGDPWVLLEFAEKTPIKLALERKWGMRGRQRAKKNGCSPITKPLQPMHMETLVNQLQTMS